MQIVKNILLKPLSLLYVTGVRLRHWLFDSNILRSYSFDMPIICVGNITVGGTGKSPMSEMLLGELSANRTVALLSRGYGRQSRGYIEVECDDDYRRVGDEPLQIKRKYPEVVVVVCEKRVDGVQRIIEEHPDVELIVMDDGFQHRYIKPSKNIIMVDARRPISSDQPLPAGDLRDTPEALHRADYFVVTKCPEGMTRSAMERIRQELTVEPHQRVYFSRIVNLDPIASYPNIAPPFDPSKRVIAMAGIGNPTPFIEALIERYEIIEELLYQDHHSYSIDDMKLIERQLIENREAIIITTEKDSVKFTSNGTTPQIIKERLYFTPIRMQFIDGESAEILNEIEKLC